MTLSQMPRYHHELGGESLRNYLEGIGCPNVPILPESVEKDILKLRKEEYQYLCIMKKYWSANFLYDWEETFQQVKVVRSKMRKLVRDYKSYRGGND